MKLKISDLECDVFDLSNDAEPPTILTLENISNGTGDLEFRDGLTLLNEVAIRKLLATLEFPVSSGRLRTDSPATIEHVNCEGRIRNGFAGELRSSIVESERVSLELETVKATAHVIAEGLHVKIDGRGGLIEVGTLTLSNAQCTVGTLLIRISAIIVHGLKVGWDGSGRPVIEARHVSARDLHLQSATTSIAIAVVDIPEGLRVHNRVQTQQVFIGAIELAFAELKKKKNEGEEERAALLPKDMAIPVPGIRLDHGVFDTVNGNLDVDATLSVSLPVIGKRVATHTFRIPVDGGILNYKDFEDGLSDLEDAFINICLRGKKLALERDIPLIPGMQKPIVTWDLEAGEVELAAKHLVRIGTLLKYDLAGDADDDGDRGRKSRVKLHRLNFDNINVNLSLDETAVLSSGEGSMRAHVDELAVAGSLHFDPDPEDEVAPTSLALTAKGLGTVAQDLVVAGHNLSAGLSVGSVESFRLEFDELRPTTLDAALKNVSVHGVDFSLDRAKPRSPG